MSEISGALYRLIALSAVAAIAEGLTRHEGVRLIAALALTLAMAQLIGAIPGAMGW